VSTQQAKNRQRKNLTIPYMGMLECTHYTVSHIGYYLFGTEN
jgi:hypothetical protein